MKKLDLVNGYNKNKDFLAVEKDAYSILDKLIKNEDICKLLYFNTPDALDKELTAEKRAEMIDLGYINIKQVFPEDEKVKNFIMISFDNFSITDNPLFMDYTIEISIFCHQENFDFKKSGKTHIRDLFISHLIMEELNNSKMNGIGKLNFIGASSVILGSDTKYSGKSLVFTNYHGLGQEEERIIDNNSDGYE